MNERSLDILEAAIREYIATGAPVSSSDLFQKYDFGIRPAMIRAELSLLTEEGYLEQPYHSAGRVPSNKGYEFFAARAISRERKDPVKPLSRQRGKSGLDELAEMLAERAYDHLLAKLSNHLGLMGAMEEEDRGLIMKNGLDRLVESLSWSSREELMEVIRDFQSLERRLGEAGDSLGHDFLHAFIGRKSPVTKSDDLAVMAAGYDLNGTRVILFAIGPKRMDYEKAAALFKGIRRSLKDGRSS